MSQVRRIAVVACASCGAGVPMVDGVAEVACSFCSTSTRMPDELSARTSELEDSAQSAHKEGMAALTRAVHLAAQPGGLGGTLGAMTTLTLAVTGVILGFVYGESGGLSVAGGFFGGIFMGLLGFAAIANVWGGRHRTRAMGAVRTAIEGRTRKAKCPSCSGPLAIPPFAASLSCPACDTPLLASEGILIERLDDALERHKRWTRAAEHMLQEDRLIEEQRAGASDVALVVGMAIAVLLPGAALLFFAIAG